MVITMTQTPYEIIGSEALYNMIDHFYMLVAKDQRINHLFPGDFEETSRKQKQFLTQFLEWSKSLFTRARTSNA